MRKKLLALNTFTSLLNQIVAIACGFIVPRLILSHFGSEINGLTQSITQFLHVIVFLELGIGAVVQSALYRPLVLKDSAEVSRIMASANKFFRRLAAILAIYVVVLVAFYPLLVNKKYDFLFTATLILAISISSFAQYYFGIVNSLLVTADQHGYINYLLQSGTLILNTIACVILIDMDASIQMVKFTTSVIFLLRPVLLCLYVKSKYTVNWNIYYDEEPIKQKWNGIAQHIAAIVLDSAPMLVLTVFSSLTNVSIYAVYNLVCNGVRQLVLSLGNGIQAVLGELWARQDMAGLTIFFGMVEWAVHSCVTFFFGCTALLIVPFVTVYTNGVSDANYYQPLFAVLLVAAAAARCIRLPYNLMILAAGHYKETQENYNVATVLVVIVSIAAVKLWGLAGSSLGIFIALLYQTVWMVNYDSKHLVKWPLKNVIKQTFVDFLIMIISYCVTSWFELNVVTYIAWLVVAIKTVIVFALIWFIVNFFLCKEKMLLLHKHLVRK